MAGGPLGKLVSLLKEQGPLLPSSGALPSPTPLLLLTIVVVLPLFCVRQFENAVKMIEHHHIHKSAATSSAMSYSH